MKQKYNKPSVEIVELDARTTMMSESVTTEVGKTPSHPDANAHRGSWGDLWGED